MKQHYDIFTQDGELYERIFVTGEDEAECEAGVNAYLDTKQNCYAQLSEDDPAAAAWLHELDQDYSASRL